MRTHLPLYQRIRPTALDQVVGQDKAVASIRKIAESEGFGGRFVWLSGASGVGKTTLARIIAATLADDFFVTEYDSGADFDSGALESMRESMMLTALGRGGRAWIINEAHMLGRKQIAALLGIAERLPRHCVVIFTTTKDGEDGLFDEQIDAPPLMSRCHVFRLTNQGLSKPFAELARRVAQSIGRDGHPIDAYVKACQRVKNNCRALLQLVEAGDI